MSLTGFYFSHILHLFIFELSVIVFQILLFVLPIFGFEVDETPYKSSSVYLWKLYYWQFSKI